MRNSRFNVLVLSAEVLALAMTAAPAYAEQATLICRGESNQTYTFRIDYATGRLEEIAPSGNAYTNRIVTASVSPNAIVWSIDQPSTYLTGDNVTHQTTEHWEGHLDRLAATGWVNSYNQDQYHSSPVSVTCMRSTGPVL